MNLRDNRSAVAHCCGDTFCRAGANVTNGEYARHARFERWRGTACQNEPLLVRRNRAAQPTRVWRRSDEQEQMAEVVTADRVGGAIANKCSGQSAAATIEFHQVGADMNVDIGQRGDPGDEIAGLVSERSRRTKR